MSTFTYRQTATVTRWSATSTDAYGLETGGWSTFWEGACSAQPMTGEERLEDRETQVTRLKVFLPAAAAGITNDDRISIDGGPDLNIEQVADWPDPLAAGVHHVELRVRQEV